MGCFGAGAARGVWLVLISHPLLARTGTSLRLARDLDVSAVFLPENVPRRYG